MHTGLRRTLPPLTTLDTRAPIPPLLPGAPEADSYDEAVGDQSRDTIATRPEYFDAPPHAPLDPTGFLSDILDVLLGSYSGKGRPEQINVSPGFGSVASQLKTHVRYHVTGIKGSNGAAGHVLDIKIGTELIETIYNFAGVPWYVPASFWIDRATDVTVTERGASVAFTCIFIASEGD